MSLPIDCLNHDVLDVIRSLQDADDPNILDEIIRMYLDDSQVAQREDMESIRIAAHTLKGSSANVGAQRLADVCKSMETFVHANDFDELAKAMPTLRSEFDFACVALTAELSDKAA